jgi:predicted Zn-dependent protease
MRDVRVLAETSKLDDASLKQLIEKADKRLQQLLEESDQHLKQMPAGQVQDIIVLPSAQKYATPSLWSDTTFNVTAQILSDAVHAGVNSVRTAKMFAAGFAETRAVTWAIFNTRGLAAYAVGTAWRYSESVRNPEGTGSGWAGTTNTDWTKLDVPHLSERALQKCVASVNPVAVEPGRYTVILEPEAAGKFIKFAVASMDLQQAEGGGSAYSGKVQGKTKIGERIFDQRLTISTDPADPECSYIPFDGEGYPYQPVTWVEKGVLKELPYDSAYAIKNFGTDIPLSNPDAFRISGGDTSIEEMITTTERGLLVTRFGLGTRVDRESLLISTVTRDGLWLIEKGKIKCPVKNMRVLESPLIVCNTVLQLGKPERILGGTWIERGGTDLDSLTSEAFGSPPIIAPSMKLQDFNFVGMSDAI